MEHKSTPPLRRTLKLLILAGIVENLVLLPLVFQAMSGGAPALWGSRNELNFPPSGSELLALIVSSDLVLFYAAVRLRFGLEGRRLLVLNLASVLLFLVAMELSLGVYVRHTAGLFRPDPSLVWRLAPDIAYSRRWGVATNSRGMRCGEFAVPKPAGTFRLLVLGDSALFGQGVDQGETYAANLQRLLHERYPARTIEVVNAAVPGYTTFQGLAVLRGEGLSYGPDVVIVGFNNDPMKDCAEDATRVSRSPAVRAVQAVLYRSNFFLLLRKWLLPQGAPLGGVHPKSGETLDRYPSRVSKKDFGENLEEMCSLAGGAGSRLLFIAMPMRFKDAASGLKEEYNRIMADCARRRMELFQDSYRTWLGGPSDYFLDGCHPTAKGQEHMARETLEILAGEHLLGSRGVPAGR